MYYVQCCGLGLLCELEVGLLLVELGVWLSSHSDHRYHHCHHNFVATMIILMIVIITPIVIIVIVIVTELVVCWAVIGF